MSRYLHSVAVLLVCFGLLCLTPMYGANKGTHQDDPGGDTPQISALSGQATHLGTGREVVMTDLPQAAPYHGKPRAMPDQKEPNEGDEDKATGTPSAGYKFGPASLAPRNELPPSGLLRLTFGGGSEETCGGWIPSDHALATSSLFALQVLNACIYVYDLNGNRLSGPKDLATFFGASGDAVGDPRCLYDWRNQRFLIVAEDFTANNIVVAASKTANPSGSWWTYTQSANSGGLAGSADFPMIGQTEWEVGDSNYGALYISWDRFGSNGFTDDVVWIWPKNQLYSGGGFSFNYFYNLNYNGHTVDHVQPADVMTKGDQPRAEFLVNTLDFNYNCVSSSPCNGLVVWAIYYGLPPSGSSPSLTGKFISTANNYVYPVTASQPGNLSGTECAINTGNTGITSEVYWNAGDLYLTASTAALNGQASDGWLYWQVHPFLTDASPSTISGANIRNEVCWGCNGFNGDATLSEYYPAAQPDEEGNVAVVFNYSSSSVYPSTAFLASRTTQATGGFNDGGGVLAGGNAPAYCQLDQYDRNRWGDYTGTSPFGTGYELRPTFWFAGQYSETSGDWATTVGQSVFSDIRQP